MRSSRSPASATSLIDRTKVVLTRRAAAAALRGGARRHEGPRPQDHLGRAWTPRPAGLFLADQAAHLAVAFSPGPRSLDTPPAPGWVDARRRVLGAHDRAAVHRSWAWRGRPRVLLIVNVRAASLFVGDSRPAGGGGAMASIAGATRGAGGRSAAARRPPPAAAAAAARRPGAGRSGSARSTRASRPSRTSRPHRGCRLPSAPPARSASVPGSARRSACWNGSSSSCSC